MTDRKVKYGNGTHNWTMHKAVLAVSPVMTVKMREVVIATIEYTYGKDVISFSYNKLWRLLAPAVCCAETGWQ